MTRSRTVSNIYAELVDEHHFKLKMTTQAGTLVEINKIEIIFWWLKNY
jgi:hypothetical protein